ncbi:unnamed protein product [Vitrella brassicaformis CCMP3155]|uniref:Uncharacterized protein n=1 Tax=Vitrella brassicaformis (strain CCMP3155) TaxID=1169540 RepID=A0A0G4EJE8_VITBC|nr:unnamed protein product [Vitrella brassicaformis CCMP3155]|eukprot:CEL96610.1 unnamed protein product [Vitrella brassicaformis CCMP3155]
MRVNFYLGPEPGNASMQSQPLPPQTAPPAAGEPHVLHIPVHQEVHVRDRIVEIPEIHLVEVIKPKVTIQEVNIAASSHRDLRGDCRCPRHL